MKELETIATRIDVDAYEAFVAEFGPVANQITRITLDASYASLLGFLGILQMALRHPKLADVPSAAYVAQFARAIETRLAEIGPATARLASMGWSPENDM